MLSNEIQANDLSRRAFFCVLLTAAVSVLLAESDVARCEQDATETYSRGDGLSPMDHGRPSSTAQEAAIFRAAHQILDNPKILDDPLAIRIIGKKAEASLRTNPDQYQKISPLRALIVLRSRYAEDELAKAAVRGVRQYVILGAGLDTFAYRNQYQTKDLRVFEVDHPSTQAWKVSRLREAGIPAPDNLTFAPIDFERQTLLEGLKSAGFNAKNPSFFSMLGVVVYLTEEAVIDSLRSIASLPQGTEVVFDYPVPSSLLSQSQQWVRAALARRVAELGEPWITYFFPDSLAAELRYIGFSLIKDLGPEEANDRYFKNRSDGLMVSGSSRIMKVRV